MLLYAATARHSVIKSPTRARHFFRNKKAARKRGLFVFVRLESSGAEIQRPDSDRGSPQFFRHDLGSDAK